MGVQRKQYTAEFKRETVRLVIQNGVSVAQAARDLGVNENMIHRWKKEFEQKQEYPFPGQEHVRTTPPSRLARVAWEFLPKETPQSTPRRPSS